MSNEMWRQGDLLIEPGVAPEVKNGYGASVVKNGIVELGEATGHAHRLVGGEVREYVGDKYLITDGTAELIHDEHDTIVLPEGEYKVRRQREYSEEGWSNVWD